MANHHFKLTRSKKDSFEHHMEGELDQSSRFARPLGLIISGAMSYHISTEAADKADFCNLIRCNTIKKLFEDEFDPASYVPDIMYDDLAGENVVASIFSVVQGTPVTWPLRLKLALDGPLWYADDSFRRFGLKDGTYATNLSQLRLAGRIARAACNRQIELMRLPAISNVHQAVFYLISNDRCHNEISKAWLLRHPKQRRSRSAWYSKYPSMSAFCAAQALVGEENSLEPAFTN